MGNNIKILHGFFVDDVLIKGMLNRFAWLCLFIKAEMMDNGMKYLEYHIKPCNYRNADWKWLVGSFLRGYLGRNLDVCCWGVGSSLPMLSLTNWGFTKLIFIISLSPLFTVLYGGGSHGHKKYHLEKLSNITLPKVTGGWQVLDLRHFGRSLLIKSLWRGIFGSGS